MSNKTKKAEKRERVRRESVRKKKIRSIALLIIGFIALVFDAGLARMAYERYKDNEKLQYGTLGIAACVSPYIVLALIIIVTVLLLLKQNRKR